MSKRKDYISWNQFFMGVAKLASQRSKDPNTQVGACIIKDNKILGIGYNGFPTGCSDDKFPWTKPEKYLYVCHAEANALINVNNFNLLKESTMYCTLFPCNECAKLIIQVGIKKIIYIQEKTKSDVNKEQNKAAKKMFDALNITYEIISYK